MINLKKKDVLLAVSMTLMLALLANIQVVNARPPDEDTWGIAEDIDEVGGSGWYLCAKVKGEWHWIWQVPDDYILWYWFYHEGCRSTWFTIVIIKTLDIWGEAGGIDPYDYHKEAGTYDYTVYIPETGGKYTYGRTYATAWFRDWLWGIEWQVKTDWATLGTPPP